MELNHSKTKKIWNFETCSKIFWQIFCTDLNQNSPFVHTMKNTFTYSIVMVGSYRKQRLSSQGYVFILVNLALELHCMSWIMELNHSKTKKKYDILKHVQKYFGKFFAQEIWIKTHLFPHNEKYLYYLLVHGWST